MSERTVAAVVVATVLAGCAPRPASRVAPAPVAKQPVVASPIAVPQETPTPQETPALESTANAQRLVQGEKQLNRVRERLLKLSAQSALVNRGTRRAEQKRLLRETRATLRSIEQVLRTEPRNPVAWYQKSVALYYLGDFSAAERAAKQGLRVSPGDKSLMAIGELARKRN